VFVYTALLLQDGGTSSPAAGHAAVGRNEQRLCLWCSLLDCLCLLRRALLNQLMTIVTEKAMQVASTDTASTPLRTEQTVLAALMHGACVSVTQCWRGDWCVISRLLVNASSV
jgi:hypothetical protein